MFPVLFALGPFSLRTMSLFVVLAFLLSGFVFWKRGRAEHYSEEQLFDGFLLSLIVGLLFGRASFIAFHFSSASVWQWLNPIALPGVVGIVSIATMGLYLYRFSKRNKWDGFEILDLWSLSLVAGLVVLYFGSFFSGSGVGFTTSLPWGVRFPGLIDPAHPVQLYQSIFFSLLFWYLSWTENRYRTFAWYRGNKKTAQTGFIISATILALSGSTLFFSFLQPPAVQIFGVNFDQVWSIFGTIFGAGMLYSRSGRLIPLTSEWLKQKRRLEKLRK